MKINLELQPKDPSPRTTTFWRLCTNKNSDGLKRGCELFERLHPLFHQIPRQVHQPRLDRMDARFPVRLRHPAVRRHRRDGVPRDGPRAHGRVMAPHVSHIGVHDHGFNNVSTYGNLLRLMDEGRIPENQWEPPLRTSWLSSCPVRCRRGAGPRFEGGGFIIHSFNGPHSFFIDTIRSFALAGHRYQLGTC